MADTDSVSEVSEVSEVAPQQTKEKLFFTAEDRESYVQSAVSSEEMHGNMGPYHFNIYPKNIVSDEEDPRRKDVTEALAAMIHKNPKYRAIRLSFYETLVHKISNHPVSRWQFAQNNIIVLVKGGVAYQYAVGPAYDQDFPFSDLDIEVHINPALDIKTYEAMHNCVSIILTQTMAQYKRMMDSMFGFTSKPIPYQVLDPETVDQFKKDHVAALAKLAETGTKYVSPFEDCVFRNMSSRYSFLLLDSNVHADSVVKVEVPHFHFSEKLPLAKTPFFCSINKSIDFKGGKDMRQGHIDLYRIRFNSLCVMVDDDDVRREVKVPADFIDVSIASKADTDSKDFWATGQYMDVRDPFTNIVLRIPTIPSSIKDLYKMLYIYDCPASKKQARIQKYMRLMEIQNMRNFQQMRPSPNFVQVLCAPPPPQPQPQPPPPPPRPAQQA